MTQTAAARRQAMTLEEIMSLDREFLLPREVAAVLGTTDQGIRVWARQRPGELGFPTICVGHRVKIPKAGFVAYMRGANRGVRFDEREDETP